MKQLHITISGHEDLVINLEEDEAIEIHLLNNAAKFLKPGEAQTKLVTRGMRWKDEEFFNFDWGSTAIELGDKVSIQIVESDRPPTPARAEEKYIEPEKECTFCGKKASEVKHLVEGSLFSRICDDCVVRCQALMETPNAT
jgi:hypothetical protein